MKDHIPSIFAPAYYIDKIIPARILISGPQQGAALVNRTAVIDSRDVLR